MHVIRITAPHAAELVAQPDPEPGPDEVLLRIAWVGLCGSDLSTWRGGNPLVRYPRIPGHEVAGTVVALGGRVTEAAIGEQVLVIPYTACGRCHACRAQRPNCCRDNQTLGVQRDGALGSLVAVPESKLLRIPGLALDALALVEPLSVGFHAASRARVRAGEPVVVIGCGAVGMGAVAAAAAAGALVTAVDVDPRKLDMARRLGATATIDARSVELLPALQAIQDGDGPSVCIEAAGQAATFRTAVEAVAYAGRVVYIGYTRTEVAYDTKRFVQKELDIMGSRNATRADFVAAGAWLASDPDRARTLVTRTVPLAHAIDALQAWDADPGAVCKILVDCGAVC